MNEPINSIKDFFFLCFVLMLATTIHFLDRVSIQSTSCLDSRYHFSRRILGRYRPQKTNWAVSLRC